MPIKEKLLGQVDVLSIQGRLMGGPETTEIHTAIKSALEKKVNHFVIDLKDVEWMGSVGIGILICCLTTVRNAGGELKLSGLSEKMMRLLMITKLEHVFEIHPQADQAAYSFNLQ
jgi:anti-sigma B factor antagonist